MKNVKNAILGPILGPFMFAKGVIKAAFLVAVRAFGLPFEMLWNSPIGVFFRRLAGNNRALSLIDAWSTAYVRRARAFRAGTHWASRLIDVEKKSKRVRRLEEEQHMLVMGEMREYAERIAPPGKYPTLYTNVPEDLSNPLVIDGRLLNGAAPARYLAGLAVTDKFIKDSWANATEFAARMVYFSATFGVLALYGALHYYNENYVPEQYRRGVEISSIKRADASKDVSTLTVGQREGEIRDIVKYVDVWSQEEFERAWTARAELNRLANEEKANAAAAGAVASAVERGTFKMGYYTLVAIFFTVISLIVAYGLFRYFHLARLRRLVVDLAGKAVMPARMNWREGIVRWRHRARDIVVHLEALADQVKFATQIDRSPVIYLGRSTGLLESRGHLLGAEEGKPVCMSLMDLLQHVEVLGGSGEGKSRNFYVPVVKQLLELRKKGYPIGLYATDDKGAIGVDIIQAAREIGLAEDEIIVVGTGPNDYRVDLLDGLMPNEFGDILRAVIAQTGGSSGDAFWDMSAADLAEQVAWVMKAYERTPEGANLVKQTGVRMYSVVNVFRYGSNDALLRQAINAVLNALQNKGGEYKYVAKEDSDALNSAYEFLIDNWMDMVDSTKDGIRANLRKALRGFASKEELSDGFATGNSPRLISTSELMSNKVKIINISQIEHGFSGRLVSIMLKTIFFKMARAAEQRDPVFAKKSLTWWFNPNPNLPAEEKDKYAINFFIADEYQGLVSSGGDGVSDATVWNVLRSARVGGILLSQGVSAYRMVIGAEATDNMRRNWRTKIFLRTEDLATIDEARHLAGSTLRFYSHAAGAYESAAAIRCEHGYRVDAPKEIDLASEDVSSKGFLWTFMSSGKQLHEGVDFVDDWMDVSALTLEQAMDGANFDEEDMKLDEREADEKVDYAPAEAVQEQDIMDMGRGRALVFVQRAGLTRVEVIKLSD